MEEKLQEILDKYEENITRHEKQLKDMEAKIEFCVAHNFEEEARITSIKCHDFDMAILFWRNMHKEIQEMLNKWLS